MDAADRQTEARAAERWIAGLPAPVVEGLRAARRAVVLTGAGISAESGIPTFRDTQTGLWARFNPLDLASPAGFAANPQRVWDWYRYRRGVCRRAEPNPAHHAVVALEAYYPDFLLATQNIDGLHRRVGSRAMLELHGSLERVQCSAEPSHDELPWDPVWDEEGAPIPCCACGALLRPAVVWFGEPLRAADLRRANAAAAACQAFFCIGTSATVQPAALLPLVARQVGALVIEINPEPTSLSPLTTATILGRAGAVLPRLVEVIRDGGRQARDQGSGIRDQGSG